MRRRQLGLALFSAALLLFQISLTRFYSVRYYPPVVFAVLSLALLGIGLGAAIAAWRSAARQHRHTATYAAILAFAMPTSLVVPTHWAEPVGEAIGWALTLLTFLAAGLTVATLYAAWSQESPSLYWSDLTGAGIGAILAAPVLGAIGVLDALLLAALAAGLAAILFRMSEAAPPASQGWGEQPASQAMPDTASPMTGGQGADDLGPISRFAVPLLASIVAATLLFSNLAFDWLTVDMGRLPTEKPISQKLAAGGQILHTTWDGFARTDLVDPGQGLPYELYMDGAAGSIMPPAGGHTALWRDIGFFPYATEQPEQVFIVGAGGGLDIWFALQGGAEAITAVDVNAASVRSIAENRAYNESLAEQPGVRLVVDEARSLLTREDRAYDLISLSQVVTAVAERDGYALVENDIYTVEAFETYLQHLRENGIIALKLYDEITLARALTTAMAALQARGLSEDEAMQHLMALADARVDPPAPLLLIRNRPFTREDSLSLGAVASEVGFTPLYLPSAWAEPPLDALAKGEISLAQFIAESDSDLSPTSDDRPFFFQFARGLPASLGRLLLGVAALALAVVAAASIAGVRHAGRSGGIFPFYFALLGFGFFMAEVATIQQVRLYLGHPTYAIGAVLATLLIGGGLGSKALGRLSGKGESLPKWPGVVVFGLMIAWALLWPTIRESTAATAQAVRMAVAILTLLPLGFFMGMPFPAGLRAAGRVGERTVAAAWAVNGVLSVLGSVAAVSIAILAGFNMVYAAAAVCYLLAALVANTVVAGQE